MNITDFLNLNGHINMTRILKPEGPTHMNNSALEPVLFEKIT